MKFNTSQQEILFMITTTLSKRQLWERNAAKTSSHYLFSGEQMIEACWQGILSEMFPELIRLSPSGHRLYIWQIHQHHFALQVKLSEIPFFVEKQSSIDPQCFLPQLFYN